MKTAKKLFEKNKKNFYCKKRIEMVSDLVITIYKNNDEDELTLLDIGCGAGSLFDKLVNYKEINCYGIDVEEPYVEFARNRGHDVTCGDFTNIKIKGEYFDVITLIEVLEHINEPRLVLEKAYIHLKKKGKLIITVPSCSLYRFLKYRSGGIKEAKISELEHYFEFSPDIYNIENPFWYSYTDLFNWFKKAGFEIKEVRGNGILDFPKNFALMRILGSKKFSSLDNILGNWFYKILGCRSLLIVAEKA